MPGREGGREGRGGARGGAGVEGVGEHEGVGGHEGPRRPLAWDLGKNLPSVTLCDTLAGSHEGFSCCSSAAAAAPISQQHISSRGSTAYSSHPSLGVFSLFFYCGFGAEQEAGSRLCGCLLGIVVDHCR